VFTHHASGVLWVWKDWEGSEQDPEDLQMMDRKYDTPEPKEDTKARAVAILVLAGAVVLGMVLIATGAVPVG
jgi:hypothetical protein